MWPFKRPSTPGSESQQEQEIRLLKEQNALLRAALELRGVTIPKPRPTWAKKLTAADVTVVTRDSILERQIQQKAKEAEPPAA